jgi:hypothetical protein
VASEENRRFRSASAREDRDAEKEGDCPVPRVELFLHLSTGFSARVSAGVFAGFLGVNCGVLSEFPRFLGACGPHPDGSDGVSPEGLGNYRSSVV